MAVVKKLIRSTSASIKIRIRGAQAELHGVDPGRVLPNCLRFKDPQAHFRESFRRGDWDGLIDLFTGRTFPAGLSQRVIDYLVAQGEPVDLVELRNKEAIDLSRLTTTYIVDPSKEGFELRPHQMEGILAMLQNVRGVVQAPTGSGKTEMMAAAARYLWEELGWRTLVVEPKLGVAIQTARRFEMYFQGDVAVGLLAEGRRDVGPVTVATAQTLLAFKPRLRKGHKGRRAQMQGADAVVREVVKDYEVLMFDECLARNTLISTPSGPQRIADLRPGSQVLTPTGEVALVKTWWQTRKRAKRYVFAGGYELIASDQHLIAEGSYRTLTIKPIAKARSALVNRVDQIPRLGYDHQEYLYGWFLGDGTCFKVKRGKRLYVRWAQRLDVEEVALAFARHGAQFSRSANERGDHLYVLTASFAAEFVRRWQLKPGKKANTLRIPDALVHEASVGVIKGLFDAEASRTADRITFDLSSAECVEQVAQILRARGVACSLGWGGARKSPKHVRCRRLTITGDAVNRYNALFGFEISRKQRNNLGRQWAQRHLSTPLLHVDDLGERDLIDIELDNHDRLFIANGLVSHNCHRTSSESWYEIAMESGAHRRFGLSATPIVGEDLRDAKLIAATGPVLYEAKSVDLIEQGFAARPKIVMVMSPNASGPDLPTTLQVMEKNGHVFQKRTPLPYAEAYMRGIVQNEQHNRAVVLATQWLVKQRRQTIILCRRKEHFLTLADLLDEGGISFLAVWGTTETSDRDHAKRAFAERAVQVVLATTIWDEGEDIRTVEAIVLAEGVKVSTNSRQRVGRGMRPDTEDVWVVDFVPTLHPKLVQHAYLRALAYEQEGYEVRILDRWPGSGELDFGDELLPFLTWDRKP